MVNADGGAGGEFWGQDPMNSEKWAGAVGRSSDMAADDTVRKPPTINKSSGRILLSSPGLTR